MFKKSRRKIVAAIMAVLALLFLGTLGVIYTASYLEVSESNFAMLARHAEMYVLYGKKEGNAAEKIPSEPVKPDMLKETLDFERLPKFQLSTFYSVALSYEGEVLETDTSDNGVYEETELEQLAALIAAGEKTRGMKGDLLYVVSDKPGYILVAFMDNRIMHESINTLFRYTLIFGGAALAALFFLAVYLAKRIVQPLEESYRKQKQFISDAGHELKTPIAVVNANAEMLQREIGENRWLANIEYENERMRLLVGQLLELAKTENTVPHIKRLDLSRLVTGEVLPFESVAFEKGLSIETDIAPGLYVAGDNSQLKQLTSILVDNALRHSGQGKCVSVILTENRGFAQLSVVNAGAPIPQKHMEHLFERFYRLDEARSDEEHHYGLGLAIAKAIVVSHKGKIEVRCDDGQVVFCASIPKA